MSKAFNPNDHGIKIRGGQSYIPVAARIVWFHNDYPEWGIETELVTVDHERNFAVIRCTIRNESGRIMAQATKMEDKAGFGDFLEKAETGSVGRALAFLGYGTLGAKDFDEGERFADAPQEIREPAPVEPPPTDARFNLLNALYEQAVVQGVAELMTAGDYPSISKVARTICVWVGREVGKQVSADDILCAISNLALWVDYQRAPIVNAQPIYSEESSPELNGIDPPVAATPPVADRALFEVPAPTVTVQGGYSGMEAAANRTGNADPQGRKNARK